MKRLLLASVALSAFTGMEAARAGDVPPEVIYPAGYPVGSPLVPPVVAPNFTFTGFYAGGTIGGAAGSSKYKETTSGTFATVLPAAVPNIAAVGTSSTAPRGVIGGIEGGYNWQVGHFVLGFETDFSGWDMSSSAGVVGVGNPYIKPM
jgi:outer membrane immunogenic protein